ncbi:MAG: hypothetical protein K2Y40_03070 [Reyranella sp.]|jgi:hypothetical protein|nr:hypothetical protein [Reyranella sp.]
MAEIFRGTISDREGLPQAITQLGRIPSSETNWRSFVKRAIPLRGGAVGTWSVTASDPLAEVLIVRDEDFNDTIAWLNSFFAGLSPVTQWCRVVTHSQASRIADREEQPRLGNMLGAWVGAILAECSVQAGGVQNMRDMPGSAATSSATFAAGRAEAVWNRQSNPAEVARRHDELSQSLREGNRPIGANSLVPVWAALSGRADAVNPSDRRALEPLIEILGNTALQARKTEPAELVTEVAIMAERDFNLPEILECASGPQVERVRALDRLGEKLASGPKSPVIDALLGMGASFVEPGSAIAPELLRRYGRLLPTAPIWQGVFAGAFSPIKVLTDQAGLGRLIAKALLAADDLHGRPTCDIAYEELIRWITPGRPLKSDLRGMSARALSVELLPGVTCAFAFGRADASHAPIPKADSSRPTEQKRAAVRTLQEIDSALANVLQRIETLETRGLQRSLALPEPKDNKTRKRDKS